MFLFGCLETSVWVCDVVVCLYRRHLSSEHLFPFVWKKQVKIQEDLKKKKKKTSVKERRPSVQGLIGTWMHHHHPVRMGQRVCLRPCPASVTAVYIGPDGGGLCFPGLHLKPWTETPCPPNPSPPGAAWLDWCRCHRDRLFCSVRRRFKPRFKHRNAAWRGRHPPPEAPWRLTRDCQSKPLYGA